MNDATRTLEPFVGQWAVLLTTYKRDGTPVGTAVNIAVEENLAYFRTWDTAWKLRRIHNNPEVEAAITSRICTRDSTACSTTAITRSRPAIVSASSRVRW